MASQREVLVGFLAARLSLDPLTLRVQVLADALSAANFSALLWWARHDDGPPAPVVVAAIDEVLRGI